MRIRNTEDYKRYLAMLGKCTCACCKDSHCGKVTNGCGFPKGVPVEEGVTSNELRNLGQERLEWR